MIYINNSETLLWEFNEKFTLTKLICTASLSSHVGEGLLHWFTTHSARNDQSTFSSLQKRLWHWLTTKAQRNWNYSYWHLKVSNEALTQISVEKSKINRNRLQHIHQLKWEQSPTEWCLVWVCSRHWNWSSNNFLEGFFLFHEPSFLSRKFNISNISKYKI